MIKLQLHGQRFRKLQPILWDLYRDLEPRQINEAVGERPSPWQRVSYILSKPEIKRFFGGQEMVFMPPKSGTMEVAFFGGAEFAQQFAGNVDIDFFDGGFNPKPTLSDILKRFRMEDWSPEDVEIAWEGLTGFGIDREGLLVMKSSYNSISSIGYDKKFDTQWLGEILIPCQAARDAVAKTVEHELYPESDPEPHLYETAAGHIMKYCTESSACNRVKRMMGEMLRSPSMEELHRFRSQPEKLEKLLEVF